MSREKIKKILEAFHLMKSALVVRSVYRRIHCRIRYGRHLRRIRASAKAGNPIRVLFLSGNSAKWKCQSLFEALKHTKLFAPMMAITLDPGLADASVEMQRRKVEQDRLFFESLGNESVLACDPVQCRRLPLDSFCPDLVFLQEPGGNLPGQTVYEISSFALCCYVPYGVQIIAADKIHFLPWFHDLLFLSSAWSAEAKRYEVRKSPWWKRSGRLEALGYPPFDALQVPDISRNDSTAPIVYAPHFSFPVPGFRRLLTLSTFLWTGPFVLAYAKSHPEQRWVFKPHPRLRMELETHGGWSRAEVDAYYAEWERIGSACYSSAYADLFRSSRAMVTDCASFLLEYSVTGKPLIRLIPEELDVAPRDSVKPLFDLFYEAHSIAEAETLFASVLERGEDPRKDARRRVLENLGIYGRRSDSAIVAYLEDLINSSKTR